MADINISRGSVRRIYFLFMLCLFITSNSAMSVWWTFHESKVSRCKRTKVPLRVPLVIRKSLDMNIYNTHKNQAFFEIHCEGSMYKAPVFYHNMSNAASPYDGCSVSVGIFVCYCLWPLWTDRLVTAPCYILILAVALFSCPPNYCWASTHQLFAACLYRSLRQFSSPTYFEVEESPMAIWDLRAVPGQAIIPRLQSEHEPTLEENIVLLSCRSLIYLGSMWLWLNVTSSCSWMLRVYASSSWYVCLETTETKTQSC